ncbi:11558_t:CDS:2 [Ambispora leptoticha]|uniref:11558_t:CDS:1 n=1 Tax=Ambispora leptoticha TaxID=144679 RepID=A0A9N9GFF9_9GLOM|nr:11558_t:CDS:2 [Ambispora leptoticha]
MDSQTALPEAPEITIIHVQLNDDIPFLIELPINEKLIEIREILTGKPEIRIGNKMSFTKLSENDAYAKILQEDEDKYYLSDILDNNNKLKFVGEIEPDWATIEKNCHLLYGIRFTESGPELADEQAFEIKELPASNENTFEVTEVQEPIPDKMIFCETESDHLSVRNFISNVKLNVNLPSSPISVTFDGTRTLQHGNHVNSRKATTYCTSKRIKARILINKSKIKATDKFLNAVDKALESNDQREALKEVINNYGQYWCQRIGVGGSIVYVQKEENKINEIGTSYERNFGGSTNIGFDGRNARNQTTTRKNALNSEYTYFDIRGGLEEEYYHERGMCGIDYKTWRAAEYSEVNSIFDLLDEKIREKIAAALKKRIIHSNVEKLDFIMDISTREPYIYEFPKELNISSSNQIFVTEMRDEETETKSAFALRVHYINENKPPVILVHRLGKLKKRKKCVTFSVKLGWIIVGTSPVLNLLTKSSIQPVFESAEIPITVNNNQFSASISAQCLNPNTSLLATCVTRSNNSEDNPSKSEYITGTYFYNKNGAVEACAFCYDRDSKWNQWNIIEIIGCSFQ